MKWVFSYNARSTILQFPSRMSKSEDFFYSILPKLGRNKYIKNTLSLSNYADSSLLTITRNLKGIYIDLHRRFLYSSPKSAKSLNEQIRRTMLQLWKSAGHIPSAPQVLRLCARRPARFCVSVVCVRGRRRGADGRFAPGRLSKNTANGLAGWTLRWSEGFYRHKRLTTTTGLSYGALVSRRMRTVVKELRIARMSPLRSDGSNASRLVHWNWHYTEHRGNGNVRLWAINHSVKVVCITSVW